MERIFYFIVVVWAAALACPSSGYMFAPVYYTVPEIVFPTPVA